MSTKVFVGNLNFSTTKDELMTLLAEAGRVVDVHLPTDRETGRPRGFAFVEFSQASEAADAIIRFHNREIGGRRLNVNAADDRPRRVGPPTSFRPSSGGPSGFSAPGGGGGNGFESSLGQNNDDFAGGGAAGRPFKNKGSRRGLRGRKRSLNY
ncbi:MAG: RNA recognition motif domain-containing protein [Candidatus Binatia bacterium]